MANLVVEYVNCLSNEADKPLYSAKNPSFFTICTVIPAKLKLPLPEKKRFSHFKILLLLK